MLTHYIVLYYYIIWCGDDFFARRPVSMHNSSRGFLMSASFFRIAQIPVFASREVSLTHLRPISILRLCKLRLLDSNFPEMSL